MAQSIVDKLPKSLEIIGENISLSPIGKGIEIYVSNEHTFGTDAVLLQNFAGVKSKDKAVDLGTGCGIIPLLMLRDNPNLNVTGLEIAQNGVALAKASAERNRFKENFSVVLGDIKKPFENLPKGEFTLVTCNPPYKANGSGILSEMSAEKIARHETMCSLEDVVKAAAGLLKFGGRLCICHRPERLGEIFSLMTVHKIQPKKLRLVCKSEGNEPWLVLVEGRLGGGKGLRIAPNLNLYEKNGKLTAEMMSIYGSYANENKLKENSI